MNKTRVEYGLPAGTYTWDGLIFLFTELEQ